MDIQIKNYADNRDLKSLKYVFVDALDVDPTFVRYEEEYNYCKSIPGLLEPHMELTPFLQDKSRWNETYWTNLKTDLVKNFSDRRMMHMKEVAQIFLAEKVQRILAERLATTARPSVEVIATPSVSKPQQAPVVSPKIDGLSKAEQEQRELEVAKRKLEEENRRIETEHLTKAKQLEQQRLYHQAQFQAQNSSAGGSSKKAIGIAVAALVVAAIVLILLLK